METTPNKPMTPEQAEDLAARTLAAIDAEDPYAQPGTYDVWDDHRARVASDLAGLRAHVPYGPAPLCATENAYWPCPDAARYAQGLRRTAALCGVTDA